MAKTGEKAPEPAIPATSADSVLAGRVLELRRAGVGFAGIAERLELEGGAGAARAAYDQAMTADDLHFASDLEVSRLDRLLTAVWPKAAKGDLAAVDRVLRISERREQLLGPPRENRHELRTAFDASVAASPQVLAIDAALVQAGRSLADRIDSATAAGPGLELTKALYLMPHLNNILRELLATPNARVSAGVEDKPADTGGKLAQLRAVASRVS